MGTPVHDPVYGAVEALTPQELQTLGVGTPGPLIPSVEPRTTQAPSSPLAGLPKGPGGFPIVPSSMRGQVGQFPGFGQTLAKNVKERFPQIAAQTAGTMIGNPYLGALAGGGAMAGGELLQGKSPLQAAKSGGITAGLGALLPGLVQGSAATVASAPFRRVLANETMQKIGTALKEKIPPFAGFKPDEKGVFQMLIGPRGYAKVHKWYDTELKAAVQRGADKEITIPASAAEVLGITPTQPDFAATLTPSVRAALVKAGKLPATPGPGLQTGVQVNAAEAIQKITGQWEKFPGEYQTVAQALGEAGVTNPAVAAGYKTWVGLRQHMSQTKAFQGERYHPERAMGGLTNVESADALSRRGLESFMNMIRGPQKHPITESGINPWMKRATGGAVGEIGAEALGMPRGLGFPVGLLAAEALVPQYRHVPVPQLIQSFTRGVSPQIAAQAAQVLSSTDAQ